MTATAPGAARPAAAAPNLSTGALARAGARSPAADAPAPATGLAGLSALPATDGRLVELTAAWLVRHRSAHTRTGYRRDLRHWLGWCAGAAVDPLTARMADVDAWIAAQRTCGATGTCGVRPAAEATIARRVAAVASWYT